MGELDMSFSQWQVFTSVVTVNLDTVNTIVGTSSLRIVGPSPTLQMNMLPSQAALLPCGLTKGVLRVLIKPVVLGATPHKIGLVSMQSQRDIRSLGSFYFAAASDGGVIQLLKASSGLDGGFTSLGSFSYTMVVGTTFSLEFQWNVAIEEINGVDLVVRKGTLTDFSDLVEIIHIIDASGPLTTTQGDGIGYLNGSGASAPEFRIDQTTLLRIL